MPMGQPHNVGVLVSKAVLRRIVKGRPTFEHGALYASAGENFGLQIVLFSIDGCDFRKNKVHGYVRSQQRWRPWRGPTPKVVHNRLIPLTLAERRGLTRLGRHLGSGLFNGLVSRDKWVVWKHLAVDPRIRMYLPATWPLTFETRRKFHGILRQYGSLVLKPRRGGVGIGVICVERTLNRGLLRWTFPNGRARITTKRGARHILRRLQAKRPYIIQEYIDLAKFKRRKFDIRVPVQRGGDGEWRVMRYAVKQAGNHRFLTNLARGGKAYPWDQVASQLYSPPKMRRVEEEISQLSARIATKLASVQSHVADLGLDIGLDQSGKPWLIEVNYRDQRLPILEAGDRGVHQDLYKNPIAYAAHVLHSFG